MYYDTDINNVHYGNRIIMPGEQKSIYRVGASNIWIFNVGPLGCFPYMLINFNNERDAVGCIKEFNELAQFMNSKMKEAVSKLRRELPNAKIELIDVYTPKYDLISNAEKYGKPC